MGRTLAIELAESVDSLGISQAVAYQLRNNHYPPVPYSMVEPCVEAIDIVQRAQWGDADSGELIELPEGISWRGGTHAPAYAIVESHHLEDFIEWEDYG